jgi:hypothetical protein
MFRSPSYCIRKWEITRNEEKGGIVRAADELMDSITHSLASLATNAPTGFWPRFR